MFGDNPDPSVMIVRVGRGRGFRTFCEWGSENCAERGGLRKGHGGKGILMGWVRVGVDCEERPREEREGKPDNSFRRPKTSDI